MSTARLAGLSILVVEDEPLLRKRYSAYLASDGADVTAVGTLREAGNALEGLDIDVVLLDVHLPDGKGTDLLRANKLSPTTTARRPASRCGSCGGVRAPRRQCRLHAHPRSRPLLHTRRRRRRHHRRGLGGSVRYPIASLAQPSWANAPEN